jgi:hypothetical protein
VGLAYSSIIALILSIVASENQSVLVGMMREVDSSLQFVDCSLNVLGDTYFKVDSARGEWQIEIPNTHWFRRAIFRGPNQLYRDIGCDRGFAAEVREMMEHVGA